MSNNVAHALSGAGGGTISMILTYPLLSVSSRLQVQRAGSSGKNEYKNTMDAFFKILAKEGPTGLYAGLGSGVFGIAITNGVYYYCYEAVKAIFENTKRKGQPMSTSESMISGAIAGSAVVLATHPIWTVNTRLTVRKGTQGEKTPSAFTMATTILQQEGIAGLYSGVSAALMLVMNPIIQYTVFENVKTKLIHIRGRSLGSLDYFILGAFSKLISTAITYPYIVVKSRMQMNQKGNDDKYTSMVDGFKKIFATEGLAGFYGGLQSKILQSVLTAAFLFMAKEALFDWAIWLLVMTGARKRTITVAAGAH